MISDFSRYVRKKRLTKRRKKEELIPKENPANKEPDSDEDSRSLEKIEKAKRKIESILEKRKEIKQKKDAIKVRNYSRNMISRLVSIHYLVHIQHFYRILLINSNSNTHAHDLSIVYVINCS